MKPFKFFQKEDSNVLNLPLITTMVGRITRRSGRTIANELLSLPTTRECAVIASSVQDFNNWRNETFDRNNLFIITNRDFTHTNGNNNITTRYRAITTINECFGQLFNDYIVTDRITDILSSRYDDTTNHICRLMSEVIRHTR